MLTLRPESLDWALRHALLVGDSDAFPRPFEYAAIEHTWPEVRRELEAADVQRWQVRPARSVLSAKARFGFRVVTQLDPLDFLIFAGLIRELCEAIESRRVPVSKNIVYSYRVKPTADGRLYDPEVGYAQFVYRAGELVDSTSDVTHVAVADIADFYPRIYHHRLENALHAATDSSNHVTAIMSLLRGWNATETFGVPVSSAPTRLLAEALLCDVD